MTTEKLQDKIDETEDYSVIPTEDVRQKLSDLKKELKVIIDFCYYEEIDEAFDKHIGEKLEELK